MNPHPDIQSALTTPRIGHSFTIDFGLGRADLGPVGFSLEFVKQAADTFAAGIRLRR